MSLERRPAEPWGPSLAQALRQIRGARGLGTAQVADLMGMDRRNYANFEAGKGRLNVERILRFAEVTDSDPWAILAGVLMGAPQLAEVAADNKMMLAFFILLGEFVANAGKAVQTLETADVISAFSQAFAALEGVLADRRARSDADWLKEGAGRISLGAPPPAPGEDERG
jgi:transcriptional regulator with XRE-family HTH domain